MVDFKDFVASAVAVTMRTQTASVPELNGITFFGGGVSALMLKPRLSGC